jgi:hypothetical protein
MGMNDTMYIMIEDPEKPGRRLYADLIIATAQKGTDVSILSIDVADVVTEGALAAAIGNDLRHIEIPANAPLSDIITEYYRVWSTHGGLLQAVEEEINKDLITPTST